MPAGNGDPALCLFPEEVTPNHHALAREFVLLDNFYVESEVTADGHEWTMAAYATDFVERTWPLSYRGDKRVPYPSEGKMKIAEPARGYLWDRAAEKGVTYRSYGEFIDNPRRARRARHHQDQGPRRPLRPLLLGLRPRACPTRNAPTASSKSSPSGEEKGDMPRLVILRLPNDHTSGTSPGAADRRPPWSPTTTWRSAASSRASPAPASGPSWPSSSSRTTPRTAPTTSTPTAPSRWPSAPTSRGSVDSTLYSTSSMLRTMELILGLDPMTQFDAAARPMWASFTAEPDLTPYQTRPAQVDIKALNTADAWGADVSQTLNLAREDAADDLIFNEIIWKAVKGADSPMPPPVRAAFVVPAREDEMRTRMTTTIDREARSRTNRC